jgi:glycine C-acetyltransferase
MFRGEDPPPDNGSPQPAPPRTLEPWLSGVTSDYRRDKGHDLLGRWQDHHEWVNRRCEQECEAYCKSTDSEIAPVLTAYDRQGRRYHGINLASQDYLNLASNPQVKAAAVDAVHRLGVHSAGSAALMGNSAVANQLEEELAAFLGVSDCTLFSTGWAAGYGVIRTLVRPHDHVVIDLLAHACLQEGARAATTRVHHFRHCSTDALEARLQRIRAAEPEAGILVVTETLFSMDSDTPDIAAAQRLATRYGATLLVDVAHDLGALGADGRGHLGLQNMLGQVDIVMGSFSKTFASNGGFVATSHPAIKLALRYNCGPLTFTNAITPIAASIVRQCLAMVQTGEGSRRRARLLRNSVHLRRGLAAAGFQVLGQASAIVPVILGDGALARLMTKHALRLGGIVNLVEYPAVSKNTCRWRLQVMADHSTAQMDAFVHIARQARQLASQELSALLAYSHG